ncbi:MAG: DUF5522 domain-containing protein, partial [Actinomycetota bacterium]
MSEAGSANEPSEPRPGRARPIELRDRWRDVPSPMRFDPDRPDHGPALAAHAEALERGQIGYLDPTTGLFVMTSVYLRDRGWCCDRG